MKRKILVLLSMFLVLCGGPVFGNGEEESLKGKVSISGAWALYPMAMKWAEEFQKEYPGVNIDVQAGGAGKGMADVLAGMVDIGMVSREIHAAEKEKGAWPFAVVKDAVVATASTKNPVLEKVLKKGVRKEAFFAVWVSGKALTWGDVLGTEDRNILHVFTRSDACGAAETWAAYLGVRQEDLQGIGVYGDPGLADAVRRDPNGIGYNNINYAYDAATKKPVPGIIPVPIDLNGNGRLDKEEDFYSDRDALTAAIRRGEYPSPPARDLYFVTRGIPKNKAAAEFIRWVLTKGQAFVAETGYIGLEGEKLTEGLNRLK